MAKANSNGSRKAVLYLRMSTDEQTESIPSQRAELTRYARTKGYTIVGEYKDEGISGDDTERRRGFLEMREAAGSGEFDLLLAWDQDRIGRFDPLDAGYWLYPFRQSGVEFETIGQGRLNFEDLTGQLVYSVNQLGKAQFLRDLSRNVTRGLLTMARDGRGTGGNRIPHGYRVKREFDEKGRLADHRLEVDPEAAELIRRIFREYLKPGASLRSIATLFNGEGLPSITGKVWKSNSIRHILANQKYVGSFVWGQEATGSYNGTLNGEMVQRSKRDRPARSSSPIIHENNHEAIIDRETFDRVQAKLEANQQNTFPKKSQQYLFGGLLQCGDCGGPLGGVTRMRKDGRRFAYMCRNYGFGGKSLCYCNWVDEGPLADCIDRKIQNRYLSDESLRQLKDAIRKAQAESAPRPTGSSLEKLRRRIAEIDSKVDQGAERVLDATPRLAETLLRKLEELQSERDRLSNELKAGEQAKAEPVTVDKRETDKVIDALRDLRTVFERADRAETRDLLATFVDRIELDFDHGQRGKLRQSSLREGRIYLRPDLLPSHLTQTGSCFWTNCPSSIGGRWKSCDNRSKTAWLPFRAH